MPRNSVTAEIQQHQVKTFDVSGFMKLTDCVEYWTLFIHYLNTIYTLFIHYLYTIYTLFIHYLYTIYTLFKHYLYTIYTLFKMIFAY